MSGSSRGHRRRSSVPEEMVGVPNVAGLIEDDAVSVVEEDIVVCGACGSDSCSHLIAKRARFNDYEHGKILDDDTGCESEMGSLNENKGVMLTMGSIVEYSRRPAPAICWRGCFHVFYDGAKLNIGEFKAHFPLKVSSRVCDTVKMIPSDLELELLPRMKDWPNSFETIHPVHEDIGVFFFFDKPDGYPNPEDSPVDAPLHVAGGNLHMLCSHYIFCSHLILALLSPKRGNLSYELGGFNRAGLYNTIHDFSSEDAETISCKLV